MSETTQQPLPGQIESPNPIELLWEKQKKPILLLAGVVVAGILAYYGARYWSQQKINAQWSEIAVTTGIDKGYAELEPRFKDFIRPDPNQRRPPMVPFYLAQAHAALVSNLGKHIEQADGERLQELIATADEKTEPLLRWVAAVREARLGRLDAGIDGLRALEERFPTHFLCAESEYPPQYRKPLDEEADEGSEKKKKGDEEPRLEPPKKGSMTSLLRGYWERQRDFAAEHTWIYEPPVPDPKPTVVVKLDIDGEFREFKIRLYREKAPRHVESFLQRVREGHFNKVHIDEVTRPGEDNPFLAATAAAQMHLGLPEARDVDRAQWRAARSKPSTVQLDFEDNDLSHFPGMVAAAPEPDGSGKSSGERIWINANDCAASMDGTRVIFGRVVEGLDVVEYICNEMPFEDTSQALQGRGQLEQNVQVESMTIIDDPNPTGGKGAGGNGSGGKKESGR